MHVGGGIRPRQGERELPRFVPRVHGPVHAPDEGAPRGLGRPFDVLQNRHSALRGAGGQGEVREVRGAGQGPGAQRHAPPEGVRAQVHSGGALHGPPLHGGHPLHLHRHARRLHLPLLRKLLQPENHSHQGRGKDLHRAHFVLHLQVLGLECEV